MTFNNFIYSLKVNTHSKDYYCDKPSECRKNIIALFLMIFFLFYFFCMKRGGEFGLYLPSSELGLYSQAQDKYNMPYKIMSYIFFIKKKIIIT